MRGVVVQWAAQGQKPRLVEQKVWVEEGGKKGQDYEAPVVCDLQRQECGEGGKKVEVLRWSGNGIDTADRLCRLRILF